MSRTHSSDRLAPAPANASANLLADASHERGALQGLWLVLRGVLSEGDTVPAVPAFAAPLLEPMSERLQVPMSSRAPGDPVYEWLSVSQVYESRGYLREAWDVLWLLEERLVADASLDQATREALLAFLCTRRGRVSRADGHLDDAERWHRDAMARCARLPREVRWQDALPNSLLGLSAVLASRGNYPEAQRLALRALAPSSLAPDFYRVQAHLHLALILRKRGRIQDALKSLWSAHDLLTEHDARHADVLATLAEVAVELGAMVPSVRARLAVLAYPTMSRVAVAALGGILSVLSSASDALHRTMEAEVARSVWGRHVLGGLHQVTVSQRLLAAATLWLADPDARGLTPYDVVTLSLAVARLALRLSDLDVAQGATATARRVAIERHYHERAFECDALDASIAQARDRRTTSGVAERQPMPARTATQESSTSTGATPSVAVVRGAALRRLLAFEHQHRLDGRAVFL